MKKILSIAAGALALSLIPVALMAQTPPAATPPAPTPGVIAGGAPLDIFLEVTTGPLGQPILSTTEFILVTGGYYRMNFVCPDARDDTTGFHFEANALLANSHLRVVSVGDIEIYLQGLTFRAIECDEVGAARFSFHPMRRGVYEILVRDHATPPQEAFVRVEVQ